MRIMSFIGVCLALSAGAHADWPGFLGPGGNPVVSDGSIPSGFKVAENPSEAENIAWRTPLPGRSVSGPIVVGDRVFTTSSSAMEGRWQHVAAVDAKSGDIAWIRSIQSTGRPYCHPTSANAAPTPCSDGQRVFAFFSSNDLVCYDLDGNLQWFRSLTDKHPLAGNDVGMSSSPVVVDGVVVVTVECQADSFSTGIDASTGETLWELPRPRRANWSSPRVALGDDGQQVVVLQGSNGLVGVDPLTGREVWSIDANCSTVATSVFANERLYVPASGVKVFGLPIAHDAPKLTWQSSRINPNSSSLMVTSIGVLGLNRSVLVCCNDDGELQWQARLPDAGQFWATPVVVGDRLYAFAMSGKCFTVKLSKEAGEVIEECELGAEVLGSPAVGQNAIFVRSVDALWKIAQD
jgi:outer membrane protein assembly factor BamB